MNPEESKTTPENLEFTEPVNTEPVNTGPVNTESVNTESVNIEPVNIEPVNIEPVNIEPVNIEPVDTEQVDTEQVDNLLELLDAPTEATDAEEATNTPEAIVENNQEEKLVERLKELEAQKQHLEAQIQELEQQKTEVQANLGLMVKEAIKELEEKKQALEISVEQLERRRERIKEEMRTSFAGVSQELAIRVQGFKDYLVGSLQDLAASAEQLELPSFDEPWDMATRETPIKNSRTPIRQAVTEEYSATPQFAQGKFQEQTRQIKQIIDRYRNSPDYYGPPWQLRRTFEPIHAERVQNWFFTQGGRGAIPTMGSRLQNILITSAVISVLYQLYSDRLRTLVLANSPERLGEWRRGLQDCLGISRSDFGPNRGLVLFEAAEPLVNKAERLVEERELPLIIIDENEDKVSLSLLQFPLWLAFAPEAQPMSSYDY